MWRGERERERNGESEGERVGLERGVGGGQREEKGAKEECLRLEKDGERDSRTSLETCSSVGCGTDREKGEARVDSTQRQTELDGEEDAGNEEERFVEHL